MLDKQEQRRKTAWQTNLGTAMPPQLHMLLYTVWGVLGFFDYAVR
jgi:hypothetical protein